VRIYKHNGVKFIKLFHFARIFSPRFPGICESEDAAEHSI